MTPDADDAAVFGEEFVPVREVEVEVFVYLVCENTQAPGYDPHNIFFLKLPQGLWHALHVGDGVEYALDFVEANALPEVDVHLRPLRKRYFAVKVLSGVRAGLLARAQRIVHGQPASAAGNQHAVEVERNKLYFRHTL